MSMVESGCGRGLSFSGDPPSLVAAAWTFFIPYVLACPVKRFSNMQTVCLFFDVLVHRPGIEPGPTTRQTSILPLNHRHEMEFGEMTPSVELINTRQGIQIGAIANLIALCRDSPRSPLPIMLIRRDKSDHFERCSALPYLSFLAPGTPSPS
uniref:Uncharacterized protein n=1 Tax=Steinernema glaseri TaxID=37863 RepID=A0A1I7ZU89_9BILA